MRWILPPAALGELISPDFQAGLFQSQELARDRKTERKETSCHPSPSYPQPRCKTNFVPSCPPAAQEPPPCSLCRGWAVNQAVSKHVRSWPCPLEGFHFYFFIMSVFVLPAFHRDERLATANLEFVSPKAFRIVLA